MRVVHTKLTFKTIFVWIRWPRTTLSPSITLYHASEYCISLNRLTQWMLLTRMGIGLHNNVNKLYFLQMFWKGATLTTDIVVNLCAFLHPGVLF